MASLLFSLLPHTFKTRNNPIDNQKHVVFPPPPDSTANISSSGWKNRVRPIYSQRSPAPTKTHKRKPSPPKAPVFSEGKDPEEDRPLCPGCGVFMQDRDPNLPGYYKMKESKKGDPDEISVLDGEEGDILLSKLDLDEDFLVSDDDELFDEEEEMEEEEGGDGREVINWDIDWDLEGDFQDEDDVNVNFKKDLDGFAPPGVGYGNITEETLSKMNKEKLSKSERRRKAREASRRAVKDNGITVCARCHSLRHYGRVKNQDAENLIPDFDFDRLIITSLMKPASTAPVVVMVVDCVDFDGSFPKNAAKSLFKVLERGMSDAKLSKLPKLVLVATKVDLLPSQVSPARLDRWVRNRAKAWGTPKLSGVYLVSAHKDLGVRNLLSFLKELSGPRSNVWVIGAQNAGKSTLINSFAKKEGVELIRLTEAAVPGTTLGIIRIGNLLPGNAKLYDTPGLLHPYVLGMWLNGAEQKMVEIRKELRPRSYRVKAGYTVHVGGVARLDVTKTSVDTIYITIWASPSISLHMGKTENADEIRTKHAGVRLQPPIGQNRLSELSQWKQKEMKISGISWEVNSTDITIAGLGWFSLGLKGEANVVLWTYDGVEVTQREPLVLDRAPLLERPGFLLPMAISDAIGNQTGHVPKAKKQDFLMEFNS